MYISLMKWPFKLCLLPIAIFLGCEDEIPHQPKEIIFKSPLEGLVDLGMVSFDNPQVGQRNYYLSFVAKKITNSDEPKFVYKSDTLVLAITGKVDTKWIVKEFRMLGSISNKTLVDTTVITHYMEIDADSIHFTLEEGSSIHFSPVGNGLSIPIEVADENENKNCLPIFDHRTNIWSAYTINYTQFGEHYDYLSNYFDYTQMAGDGWGYTFVYSSNSGFTRIAWVSAWEIWTADGWDLLPH
jgi:hypothetical protein